jgi:hypothetical protein
MGMKPEGKKRAKRFCQIAFICLVLVAVLLTANRYCYGAWNPFVPPSWIDCFHRRYYPSIRTVVLTGKVKPVYLASIVQYLCGKRIYMQFPKGKFVPTVIFLQIKDDIYLPYSLSGGP